MQGVEQDLALELSRALRDSKRILYKNEALLERIVIARSQALSGEGDGGLVWSECLDVLKDAKIVKEWEPRITKRARSLLGVPSIGGPPSLSNQPVKDSWKEAPVHSEASAPPGFGFNDPEFGSVFKLITKEKSDGTTVQRKVTVCRRPIVIQRRIMHDDGSVSLELAWLKNAWRSGIYNREHVFDSSKIVGRTAGDDMPVSSDNRDLMVEYLHAYEDHNFAQIARGWSSSAMGWQGDLDNPTKHGFLLGLQQIGGNGRAIEFHGAGSGDKIDARMYRENGSFDAWKKGALVLSQYPVFRLMTYAALTAVLLPIVGAPNCIFELVGPTSRGKTTAMKYGLTLWRSSNSPLDGWDNTVVGFESKAHLHTDMPLFVDDTKTAIDKGHGSQVAKIIYQFVSGRGRGRGDREGGQRITQNWRSFMISTGEVMSSDLARSEGAATRVLSVWGAPLGRVVDPKTATMVDNIVDGSMSENYGHAGPAVVRWLASHRDEWPKIKAYYLQSATEVREHFEGAAASRLAKVIALLDTASFVANRVGVLPWDWKPLLKDPELRALIADAIQHATKASNHALDAWNHVLSYAESRSSQWRTWGTDGNRDEEPASGWLGWQTKDIYAWLPSQLKKALRDGGYEEADSVLRKWRDRGVLDVPAGRLSVQLTCGAGSKKVYVSPILRDLPSDELERRPEPQWDASDMQDEPKW